VILVYLLGKIIVNGVHLPVPNVWVQIMIFNVFYVFFVCFFDQVFNELLMVRDSGGIKSGVQQK
jgi:hypothetical protein